jgi:opacity protein-like surface antigen
VRGRAGYAFDRLLPFITAGLAAGNVRATVPGFPGGTVTSAGWTIGAGLEFAVLSNVTVKGEYLYVDLGDYNCRFNCGLLARTATCRSTPTSSAQASASASDRRPAPALHAESEGPGSTGAFRPSRNANCPIPKFAGPRGAL